MKIGILGTGDVGKALGNGFVALGHEVKEPLCILWGGYGLSTGTFNHAFKLLRSS